MAYVFGSTFVCQTADAAKQVKYSYKLSTKLFMNGFNMEFLQFISVNVKI